MSISHQNLVIWKVLQFPQALAQAVLNQNAFKPTPGSHS